VFRVACALCEGVSMGESCISVAEPATKIGGHRRPSGKITAKIVRRKFGTIAKLLWAKPDTAIAVIAGCDARTGRRILRGEVDVPLSVMLAAVAEMVRPLD
jgi:hypothetical protein